MLSSKWQPFCAGLNVFSHPFPQALAKERQSPPGRAGSSGSTGQLLMQQRLQVILPDGEPEAFEMVLSYIYTDRIQPTKKGQLGFFLTFIVLNFSEKILRYGCIFSHIWTLRRQRLLKSCM